MNRKARKLRNAGAVGSRAARPAALALLLLVALWGCSAADRDGKDGTSSTSGDGTSRRLVLLINGPDPFWDAMRRGMQDAERDLNLRADNLRTVMQQNNGTPKGQLDMLQQFATDTDVAAVAISVTNSENPAIARALRDLQAQGIKVITVDSDVDRQRARDARFAYLGTDNVVGGEELGRAALGLRPTGGKYATFVGLKGAANAIERISGFAKGAGPKFQQLESLGDDMNLSTAQKNVRDALDRNPSLNVLVGIWAYNAHAIVEIVTQRGLRDKETIVVFDAAPLAIQHMQDGKIDAMVVQNPYVMGYEGTRLMAALVKNDKQTIHQMLPDWNPETEKFDSPEGDLITTGLKVVVPDSGSPLTKDMFAKTTEFLRLSEFKKWLAEHNLTGS
jgi:ribose transport system substrate-binding protein